VGICELAWPDGSKPLPNLLIVIRLRPSGDIVTAQHGSDRFRMAFTGDYLANPYGLEAEVGFRVAMSGRQSYTGGRIMLTSDLLAVLDRSYYESVSYFQNGLVVPPMDPLQSRSQTRSLSRLRASTQRRRWGGLILHEHQTVGYMSM